MRTCTNPIEDYYIIVLECEEITIYFVEEILELLSKIDINLSTIITYHILPYFYPSCIKSYCIILCLKIFSKLILLYLPVACICLIIIN